MIVVFSLYLHVHLFVFRKKNSHSEYFTTSDNKLTAQGTSSTNMPTGAARQFRYNRTGILFYTRSACACCRVVSVQVCMTNWDSGAVGVDSSSSSFSSSAADSYPQQLSQQKVRQLVDVCLRSVIPAPVTSERQVLRPREGERVKNILAKRAERSEKG